ncbi:hypothetical protein AMTR_s00114p00054010, partial [Amborella trichopoda]
MAAVNRKISAASARSHTRKARQSSGFRLPSGLFRKIGLVLFVGFVAWAYQASQPPPHLIYGSTNGPPVTATRIKLSDGRYLAYKESGVPREKAKYKFVMVHGFDGSRNIQLPASPELVQELGVYFVAYDRAGYGQSDPNPNRFLKSEANDIQELADQLELGSQFYVLGTSMGSHSVWACLKYIPQ